MNNYIDNDTLNNENEDIKNDTDFNYNSISGLGESDYENEDLFDTEVENNEEMDTFKIFAPQNFEEQVEEESIVNEFTPSFGEYENEASKVDDVEEEQLDEDTIEEFVASFGEYQNEELENIDSEENFDVEDQIQIDEDNSTGEETVEEENLVNQFIPSFDEDESEKIQGMDFEVEELPVVYETEENFDIENQIQIDEGNSTGEETVEEENLVNQFTPSFDEDESEEIQNMDYEVEEFVEENLNNEKNIDKEFLDNSETFDSNAINDDYVIPVVEPTIDSSKNMLSETPIEDLNKLTEYKEEKINSLDIKALFDKVGVNVKEASDIFKKNTEMKEKIDSRFEELKKLQSEVETAKKAQYDEINSYKTEVLDKLTEKKDEIEKRLNKLKEFQTSLEKEKEEFEEYKKKEKDEIERVQKEVQEAYDSRREELNHIEDVLRKQKDALDEERSQLILDRIEYESDKNELANNLLKFNEIVGSFTNGMEKIGE